MRSRLLGMFHRDQTARARLNGLRDSDPEMRSKLDSLTDPHTSDIGVIEWTYRAPVPPALLELYEADRRNLAEFRQIVQALGRWPGRSLVGDDGARAAWLIALHADRDRSFQRECLAMVEEAVAAGEAEASHFEQMEGRLDVAERRKPRHGTIWVPEDFG